MYREIVMLFGHPEGTTREGYRFFVENEYSNGGIAIHAVQINHRGGKSKAAKIVWEEKEPYEPCQASFVCERDAGQALFDALWAYGYRPNDPVNPDAMTKAKDTHIGDLRNIVEKLLGKI
jgi:hypothetical protein